MQGIDIVPVAVGLFGVAEVLSVAEQAGGLPQIMSVKLRELFPTREEMRRSVKPILRGTGLGFFLGLIPGPAALISTFVSYNVERRLSKHPEEFGQGAIEGVAGPETANNAASAGAFVPLMALGIPFAPVTAILLAGLLIQGVQPGPLLIADHPEIFWGVIASMYIGNVMLLVLNLPLVGLWTNILRIRGSSPIGFNSAVHQYRHIQRQQQRLRFDHRPGHGPARMVPAQIGIRSGTDDFSPCSGSFHGAFLSAGHGHWRGRSHDFRQPNRSAWC